MTQETLLTTVSGGARRSYIGSILRGSEAAAAVKPAIAGSPFLMRFDGFRFGSWKLDADGIVKIRPLLFALRGATPSVQRTNRGTANGSWGCRDYRSQA
jgi:hypothetical protein